MMDGWKEGRKREREKGRKQCSGKGFPPHRVDFPLEKRKIKERKGKERKGKERRNRARVCVRV